MKKGFSWVLILVFLALLMLGVVLGKNWEKILKIVSQKTTADVSKNATSSSLISDAPTVTSIPVLITNGAKKSTNNFSSQKLGVSFSYSTSDPKIVFEEQGDKVFVAIDGTPVSSGQWVEVFSKNKNETLEAAIKAKFLSGISDADCFVVNTTTNYSKNNYPSTYKIAEISFPKDESGGEPWWSKSNKCPIGYSQSNGISYFLEDINHPDKYVFFSIGQYAIPAEDHTKNWQDTIEFL